jgi:SAM-dependent methyltransferase
METNGAFDYDGIPPGYYDEIFGRNKGIQSKWHHLKFARIRQELGLYARHLDVACGPGTFLGTLSGPGHSVGLDVAAAQIEFARRKYAAPHRSFQLMQPGVLPAADASVDVVTMIELVEHLTPDDSATLLAEVRRVLRPGGRLILTTPNYGALWPLLEILVNRFGKIDYSGQHIAPFRKKTLRSLLDDCGFHIDSTDAYLFAGPFAALFGWRTADWLSWLEPRWLTRRLGHLLLAKASKPKSAALPLRRAA